MTYLKHWTVWKKYFATKYDRIWAATNATNLTPEAKRHHENVALYMFIGLVAAFLFIATIIITVELYRNGRCSKNVKLKGDKGNSRTRLENEHDDDDEGDYSEIEMNDL